jgi:hypothetical protein
MPRGTAFFHTTGEKSGLGELCERALGLRRDRVSGPGTFGGAFPEGVRQDVELDEDRARAERGDHPLDRARRALAQGRPGGVFESSDTTEDVRNYTVQQGFPVPTGRFAERGGIDESRSFRTRTGPSSSPTCASRPTRA